MNPNEDLSYERIRITGRLTAKAPLHIGSGELAPGPQDTGAIREICRDARGRPYIPASTLRGHLRQRFLNPKGECADSLCQQLFGSARPAAAEGAAPAEQSAGQAGGGRVRIFSAYLQADEAALRHWSQGPGERFESRIALDPVTGAVKPRHLLTEQLVSPGAQFRLELEADRIEPQALDRLRQALQALNHEGDAQIGQGKSIGRGGLDWQETRVQALSRQDFRRWLLDENAPEAPPWQELPKLEAAPTATPLTGRDHSVLEGELRALAPILVNDPHRPEPEAAKREENPPDHRFGIEIANSRLRIPASTLKGVLRGRARRILLTLLDALDTAAQDKARRALQTKIADDLLDRIFGNEKGASRIRLYDCTASFEDDEVHQQTFNAIDRFTGGVAHQRLYSAEAIHPKNPLPVRIAIHNSLCDPHHHWALGLLLHLLRDALEGDLAIGWGKAKGYGAFEIRPKGGESAPAEFADLLETIAPAIHAETGTKLKALAEALEARITGELKKAGGHD